MLWVVSPGHPIAEGLGPYFEIPHAEMYGEFFDIPQPDELVFISWFQGGEVFRSGCCFHRGRGKIFYFSPGHETFPIYYQPEIRQVIANAVRWAAPVQPPASARCTCFPTYPCPWIPSPAWQNRNEHTVVGQTSNAPYDCNSHRGHRAHRNESDAHDLNRTCARHILIVGVLSCSRK